MNSNYNLTKRQLRLSFVRAWLGVFALFSFLFIGNDAFAQVSNYTFSQSSGTFSAPTTGLVGTAGTASTSPASIFTTAFDDNVATMTLPFTFRFAGTDYGTVSISSNGFMVFGSTLSGNASGSAYVSSSDASGVYLSGTSTNNGVAGFNLDQQIRTGSTFTATRTTGSNVLTAVSSVAGLRVGMRIDGTGITTGAIITAVGTNTVTLSINSSSTGTLTTYTPRTGIYASVSGSAPSRVYIITTIGSRRFGNTTDNFDFQYVLYETSNVVSLVFGQMTASAAASNVPIGIRTTTADFKSRTTAADWTATTQGASNTDKCVFSSTIFPASGQTFIWTPAALAACTTPNLASALSFSAITTTSLSGSFTAASPAPSKYLVVRSTSATPPAPANGTVYTVGSAVFGVGTNVRLASNALSFTDSGLTAGTQYFYHVFSYNDNCTGEPFYSAALTAGQATICTSATAVVTNTVTANSANVTWTGSGNYIVEYGLTGFTPGTGATNGIGGTIASSVATSPFALSGLASATGYSVYVRQVCPLGGFSANSTVSSFTTLCSAITAFPSTFDFASYLPSTCWREGDLGDLTAGPTTIGSATVSDWVVDGFLNVGTTGAAKMNIDTASGSEWLISPFYTIPATGYRVKYSVGATQFGATTALTTPWEADDFVELLVSTTNTNWQILKTYNASSVPSNLGQIDEADLSAYNGQTVQFAFRAFEGAANGAADIDFFIDNFIVELIPVLPPNCATALVPANAATNVIRNSSFTWSAATGSPTSYDVYFGTSTNPPLVNNTTGLTYTPATMAANTTYFWKIVAKNANGDAIGCLEQSFATGSTITYCTSVPSSNDGLGITAVVLGATNFTIPDVTYQDNSASPVSFVQNGSSNVQITFATGFTYDSHVWIDFNDDGDFLDSGEKVYTGVSTAANPTTLNASFTMPLSAPVGAHKMRIGTADAGQATPNPCYSGTFGVTLDFIVNVLAMPTDTPDYVNLQFPAATTILAGNSATVYARVFEGGLTDTTSGQAPGIEAWIGISPAGSNSNPNTWTTWVPATFNVETDGNNNDEYQATIGSSLAVGTYYYASRFRLNGGPFVYGGNPFNFWDGTSSVSGVLTVNPNPTQCAVIGAPANAATNIVNGTVALSWTAPTSGPAPTAYKVYFGTTSGSLTLVTTTASLTFNASAPAFSTTYYWRIVPTSTIGGDAIGCGEWSFTTQADPFAPYCSSVTYSTDVEPITSVNFAAIANTSTNIVNASPALENFISIAGNVITGNSYTMTLKGNTAGNFTNNFRVFIDWNQDGDFADSGETFNAGSIINSTGIDAVQAVTNILVPSAALSGSTRMRIKKLYSADTGSVDNPCTGGQYGQSEDYTLNVTLCTPLNWYVDNDGDTFGDTATLVSACNSPGVNYVSIGGDCNDNQIQYSDSDNDGFGSTTAVACGVVNNTDCAPTDPLRWRTGSFFVDADNDGYNNGFPATSVCYGATTPAGYVAVNNGTDCNDTVASVNPNASEVLGNGIDDNCDGTTDEVTPLSYLLTGSCNVTLANLSQTLFAYQLTNFLTLTGPIQGYRFRVTNGAQVRTFDSTTSSFALTSLAGGATYATTYTVEVSVKHGGHFRAYGSACSVTTPLVPNTTNISNPSCGSTLSDISNTIFATQVPSASGYRFRVRNGATVLGTVTTSVNRFSLTSIAGIQFGTTYTVDVLLAFGGNFRPDSEYGPACSITTPATPATSRVIAPSCGSSISSFWTTIFAQQVIGAQGYKFVVTDGAQTREFATPNPRFSLRNLGTVLANTAYTIRVDVLYNSSYVQGTVLCTITTTPGASRNTASALDIYEVKAYPNPYADTFKLDLNTSGEGQVGVRVYDMLGREVESREASVDNITNFEIGSRYPSGVYNIIVTQGDNVKTLRVIKR
ncbi:GEVED domain-containing protein [Flavobacterium sp.]|uniref:GEVED domain-containing protein n=1 Tax=Flavobacterium sp. TaxID=239 RepID=UPI00286D443C|nr:GEVED domain-containing protein [Flavobacterium sp.]